MILRTVQTETKACLKFTLSRQYLFCNQLEIPLTKLFELVNYIFALSVNLFVFRFDFITNTSCQSSKFSNQRL